MTQNYLAGKGAYLGWVSPFSSSLLEKVGATKRR